jgi:pimeloyl-ACP methyl ester carboxylesterase
MWKKRLEHSDLASMALDQLVDNALRGTSRMVYWRLLPPKVSAARVLEDDVLRGQLLLNLLDPHMQPLWRASSRRSPSRDKRFSTRRGSQRRSTRLSVESLDDDLSRFESDGAAPLPVANEQGYLEHDGARIWYSTHGSGRPVILLHGGLGHSGNWGYQVAQLLSSGCQAVLIDSRGHGRSTRDSRPFGYALLASDVLAVMDALHLDTAALVGWSDGACTALVLAMTAPERTTGVYYFACNMDPSGAKQPIDDTPALARCFHRHREDYARLSPTPDQIMEFVEAVGLMQRTQPNASESELARSAPRCSSCTASTMSSSSGNMPNTLHAPFRAHS